MTAGPLPTPPSLEAVLEESAARLDRQRVEIASLRAENEALRAQLTLRDHALDATPTFFVITEQTGPEPIIVYCNR